MKKIRIILIVILILIILVTLTIKILFKESPKIENKIINEIKDYGYVLEDNKSSLYKQYFDELVILLKEEDVNEEEYVKLITKLFISDFYNLDNKTTKNDIGGTQFIYSSAKDNMMLEASNTIYKYIENNLDNKRKQDLPVVSNITIDSIENTTYKYNDIEDDKAYVVSVSWEYTNDLDYQKKADITFIHEDNKLSIVEIK